MYRGEKLAEAADYLDLVNVTGEKLKQMMPDELGETK